MSNSISENKSYHSGLHLAGLLGLLIFLNMAAFLIYYETATRESLSSYIWYYLDSEPCKVITASLILPIILFLLESRFKIAETAMKNRHDRLAMEDQERRKRAEMERQDGKTRRLEAISQTIKWWDDAFDLSAEIRYFTKPKADGATIEDLLKSIIRIVNTAEDVINQLWFTFPKLSDDVELFRKVFRILVLPSETVARSIRRKNMTSQEIEVLQDCLEVILEGVKNIAHQRLVVVLRSWSDIMEIEAEEKDGLVLDEGKKERLHRAENDSISSITTLRDLAKYLDDREEMGNKLLGAIEGHEGEDLRMKAQTLGRLVGKKKLSDGPIENLPEFHEMKDAFFNIPAEKRVMALNTLYSPEYIKDLAGYLGFQIFRSRASLSLHEDFGGQPLS